ncbi:MAG: hypothetical protein A3F09_01760 [Chlamydiae bacterium RIFCSPHIGHO2_12_FULL_49_11]|nr:MAG: hypothetical protein A3F09_01760 [Chlamydiae bacterium RIFCSPHIGHO2_12_FULL_49_11]
MQGLVRLKRDFDAALERDLMRFTGESDLSEVLDHALNGAGKRVRPVLVLAVAEALGNGLDVMPAAIGLEYFHTSTLIIDDLPCMDDERERRGREALHRAFSEGKALLASYGLIAEGFGKIYANRLVLLQEGRFAKEADLRCSLALECAAESSGFKGATLGQYLDMYEPCMSEEVYEHVALLKTVTLFSGSFVLGWLFGGGDIDKTRQMKDLAFHFGLAFQIRDDILDQEEDLEKGKSFNVALQKGERAARAEFFGHIDDFTLLAKECGIFSGVFEEVLSLLTQF